MKIFFTFCVLFLNILSLTFAQSNQKPMKTFVLPSGITSTDYLPKTIIFKIKPEYRAACNVKGISNTEINSALNSIGSSMATKKYPRHQIPAKAKDAFGNEYADLSLIYEIKYTENIPIVKAINTLLSTGIVLYAEPHYLPKLLYNPNDPFIISQYYLTNIKAYQAWDVCEGDTNIVVGIIDTGTDTLHPDLMNNLKYNWDDPVDGIDNDNDGYIDNFQGWDMGENDHTTQEDFVYNQYGGHGTKVCGVACASTNNGTGIAGVGYKTKFLPIKISAENGILSGAYDGIVYAADHGCSVINCSWGGQGAISQFEQEIINYATINRNALVVAACGNSDAEADYYPASYNYVISVGGTDINDHRWDDPDLIHGSTYSPYVDIAAPSSLIYSTSYNANYGSPEGGTSFASPIVAACAAMVKKQFPSFNAIQIGEQLKVTADNIDTIPFNVPFAGKMGSGRVNLFRALTTFDSPSVVMTSQNYSGEDYGNFSKNDTLHIAGNFTNYLAPTTNLTVTMTSISPYVELVDSTITLGSIATLGVTNNNLDPFNIVLSPDVPINQKISLKLTFTDGIYTSFQYLSFFVNIDYLIIDTNRIAATITSKGRLGYNSLFMEQGIGLTYDNGVSLMSCGSLMLANTSAKVSDMAYGATEDFALMDNDFCSNINAKKITPPIFSDFDIKGSFTDSCAGANKLNVLVKHSEYAWNNPQSEKFIIFEFIIKNLGNDPLTALYAGYYMDWDIKNPTKNTASTEVLDKMGYVYPTEGGTYTGIKLLSSGTFRHYAFDNNGMNTSIKITDGFTSYEKFSALKINRTDAGNFFPGNDVSSLVSTGPFTLNSGDSVKIAFALIVGDHLADIKASATQAQHNYGLINQISEELISNSVTLLQNIPNPFNNLSSIDFVLPEKMQIELSIFDILGKKVATLYEGESAAGSHSISVFSSDYETGVYYYRLIANGTSYTKKMIIY